MGCVGQPPRGVAAALAVVAALAASAFVDEAALSGRAEAKPAVRFSEFEHLRDLRSRPSSIHGGSDFGWVDLTWQSFGGPSAAGSGTFYQDDKTVVPYVRNRYPVSLRLSTVRRCLGSY